MIEFMVIAAPRCGTAWASNWLTTELSLCLHDPLNEHPMETWDSLPSRDYAHPARRLGIACTGVALFPDWLNQHPARKVVLIRDFAELNCSLRTIGMPEIDAPRWMAALKCIRGLHIPWTYLFEEPEVIWRHLMPGQEFDRARHRLLRKLNIQADFYKARPTPVAVQDYIRRIREAAR